MPPTDEYSPAAHAVIASVGEELVAGEVPDTNSSWLARELEQLGRRVLMITTLPDSRPQIANFVKWARSEYEIVLISGGLGGTPDDVTRAAVADAFGVGRRLDHELAATYAEVTHAERFVENWCTLPEGSRALAGVAGGAPAFAIENVYVLPGMPSEMEAAFASIRNELRVGRPRATWRKIYLTTEDRLTGVLEEISQLHRLVAVGSYARFGSPAEVEVVLRCPDHQALSLAVSHLERLIADKRITSTE